MAGLRMGEILIILVVVMLLFGATRLPQLGASLGQAIRNFKRGFSGDEGEPEAAPHKEGSLADGRQAGPVAGESARPPKQQQT